MTRECPRIDNSRVRVFGEVADVMSRPFAASLPMAWPQQSRPRGPPRWGGTAVGGAGVRGPGRGASCPLRRGRAPCLAPSSPAAFICGAIVWPLPALVGSAHLLINPEMREALVSVLTGSLPHAKPVRNVFFRCERCFKESILVGVLVLIRH